MSELATALGRPEDNKTVSAEVYVSLGTQNLRIDQVQFPQSYPYLAACCLQLYQHGFDTFVKAVNLMDLAHMQAKPLKDTRLYRMLRNELSTIALSTSLDQWKERSAREFVREMARESGTPGMHIPVTRNELIEEITRTRGRI